MPFFGTVEEIEHSNEKIVQEFLALDGVNLHDLGDEPPGVPAYSFQDMSALLSSEPIAS